LSPEDLDFQLWRIKQATSRAGASAKFEERQRQLDLLPEEPERPMELEQPVQAEEELKVEL